MGTKAPEGGGVVSPGEKGNFLHFKLNRGSQPKVVSVMQGTMKRKRTNTIGRCSDTGQGLQQWSRGTRDFKQDLVSNGHLANNS